MLNDKRRALFAIDIETVTQGAKATEYTSREKIKAPSNYKSEDAINKYIEQERTKRGFKHALSWHTGKVLSVAWEDVKSGEQSFFWSLNEVEVLNTIRKAWAAANLIGKSALDFDFPFLRGRFMANGLAIPSVLKDPNRLNDCDNFLSFSRACGQRGKLDSYAHALGLELKPMDGSHVGTLYDRICMDSPKGDKDKAVEILHEYNVHDVYIVAEMTRRYLLEA